MEERNPINETIKRTRRYWYVDGLAELASGVIIWLLAALFALQPLAPPSWRNALLAFGQPVIILLGVWGARKAVAAVKQRLTYRRTGYVSYRNQAAQHRARAAFFAAAVLAGMLAVVLAARGLDQRWIPLLMAVLTSLFMLYISWQIGLARYALLAAYILLSGGLVSWLAPAEPWDMAALFALLGLGMVVSGGWTLRTYLTKTQPLVEDAGGHG